MFNTEKFLAFLRSKPVDEEYNFTFPAECAIAQFLQSEGYEGASCCPYYAYIPTSDDNETRHDLPVFWNAAANGGTHFGHNLSTDNTFSAAADRLEFFTKDQ